MWIRNGYFFVACWLKAQKPSIAQEIIASKTGLELTKEKELGKGLLNSSVGKRIEY